MKNRIKFLTLLLVLVLTSLIVMACENDEAGGDPIEPEEVGSGDVKWDEEETEDGYMIVTNEDGETLAYSKDSDVELIQVDGYAFKDLNNNGVLDPYEDWRLEDSVRAENLASLLEVEDIAGLMLYSSHVMSVSEELEEEQISFLDVGGRAVLNAANEASTTDTVKWNNAMQAYAEGSDFGIPVMMSSDPRTGGVSSIPSNLGLASTFDQELVQDMGNLTSIEYRLLGIGTLLGPQIDLASEPRWNRVSGTFGGDPALSRDLTSSFVNGVQSTFDESGDDLGWGPQSLSAMIKHWPGDGAAEGGRESHSARGNGAVYPGGQFDTHLIPFVDGGFNLEGSTESATSVMASYSIAFGEEDDFGESVGSAFSEYKINNLLREQYGFDGVVTTDWSVLDDVEGGFLPGKPYGVSDLTKEERALKAILAGTDQFGGLDDRDVVMGAYEVGVEELDEEAMTSRFEESGARILKGYFNIGIFENSYVDLAEAEATVLSEEFQDQAYDAQLKSVVMLKNSNNTISSNDSDEKPTVYVPKIYAPFQDLIFGPEAAEWKLPVELDVLEEYYNVVTDTQAETLTGPEDEEGNPTVAVEDIVRATPEELESVDYSLAIIRDPMNLGGYHEGMGWDPENEEFIPISLQYGEYTADSEHVREESISGDITITEEASGYGVEEVEEKENRSYFGQQAQVLNYEDVNTVKYAAENTSENAPVIVAVKAQHGPMIFSEIEPYADSILMGFGGFTGSGNGVDDRALLDVVSGKSEPSALLPIQMPADMLAVEAQLEDVPRDLEVYVDSEGNSYDFTFGLDWSGVIQDDRVEKYNVPALVDPENQGNE
ncbi:glycoside hydrolase family 3 N-terminal domain-containing protein [Salipaludibacillus sp. HK11]|uniref:glycoside hydrolase family 3 protein n=1 Tax=Salipaludibacillus sp. HK11 TaxID=3394320 RepID=UPI0039FC6724